MNIYYFMNNHLIIKATTDIVGTSITYSSCSMLIITVYYAYIGAHLTYKLNTQMDRKWCTCKPEKINVTQNQA